MTHQVSYARRAPDMPAFPASLRTAADASFCAEQPALHCRSPYRVDGLGQSPRSSPDMGFPMNHARASPP